MDVKKININQSEQLYNIASDIYDAKIRDLTLDIKDIKYLQYTESKYINYEDGTIRDTGSTTEWKATDKIRVAVGTKIVYRFDGIAYNAAFIAAYDKQGNYLKNKSVKGSTVDFVEGTYIVEEGVYYIAICHYEKYSGTIQHYTQSQINNLSESVNDLAIDKKDFKYLEFAKEKFINYSDGSLHNGPGSDWKTSPMIPVLEGSVIHYAISGTLSSNAIIAAYDRVGRYLKEQSLKGDSEELTGDYIVSANVEYIRICVYQKFEGYIEKYNQTQIDCCNKKIANLYNDIKDITSLSYTSNQYIKNDTGVITKVNAPLWASTEKIRVAKGAKIVYDFNKTDDNVSLIAAYDKGGKYLKEKSVRGVPNGRAQGTYIVEEGVHYVAICHYEEYSGTIQPYKEMQLDNLSKSVSDLSMDISKIKAVVIVDINGNGDYTSLQEAIDTKTDKNSENTPLVILLMPGVYVMSQTTSETRGYYNYRNLSIIGVNKDSCIIRNDDGVYDVGSNGTGYIDNAPIKMAGNCYLENLTIISTSTNSTSEAYKNASYCVHLDFEAKLGNRLTVHNCRMINDHHCCIGVGLRNGYTIEISNCMLESTNKVGNGWGAIIVHEGPDKGDCKLILRNNVIVDNTNNGITINHPYNGKINLEFIGNVVCSKNVPITMNDKYHILSKTSYGNNRVEMNSPFSKENYTKFSSCVKKPITFEGKKALFAGDSITYGFTSGTTNVHGTGDYPKIVSEKLGMSYKNAGVAGATITRVEGCGYIKDQIMTAERNDYDILFIAGGINDWQACVELADFRKVVEEYCSYINNNYPNTTKVIWITPINQAGYEPNNDKNRKGTVQQYRNILTEVVSSNDNFDRFSIIQGSDLNFPTSNADESYITKMFGDKLHPTEYAYKNIYAAGLVNLLI